MGKKQSEQVRRVFRSREVVDSLDEFCSLSSASHEEASSGGSGSLEKGKEENELWRHADFRRSATVGEGWN